MLQIAFGTVLAVLPLGLLLWGQQLGSVFAVATGLLGVQGCVVLSIFGVLTIARGVYNRALRSLRVSPEGPEHVRGSDITVWQLRRAGAACWSAIAVFVLVAVVSVYASGLNAVTIGGFPLGYFLTAVGLPLTFLLILVLNSWTQDRVDREERAHD